MNKCVCLCVNANCFTELESREFMHSCITRLIFPKFIVLLFSNFYWIICPIMANSLWFKLVTCGFKKLVLLLITKKACKQWKVSNEKWHWKDALHNQFNLFFSVFKPILLLFSVTVKTTTTTTKYGPFLLHYLSTRSRTSQLTTLTTSFPASRTNDV